MHHYVKNTKDVMNCVLQAGSTVYKQVLCACLFVFMALWLPLTKMCLFPQFGASVFVRWYAIEGFSLEFPNQENRMPISMQEFGENSSMNERIDGLKNIIKTFRFFSLVNN